MEGQKSIIISSFCCLGKTYLGNKNKNVLDLEASNYKWIYNDLELAKDVEKRKGITERRLNPDYPQNYINALIENIDKYKIILITPEKIIREILKQKKIPYFIAYPTNYDFVIERAIKRGNNTYFANGLEKSYKEWYPYKDEKTLWIKENEYLEDVLKGKELL